MKNKKIDKERICRCCGQKIVEKKFSTCSCGNDMYEKVESDKAHLYKCKVCGRDWWCFFWMFDKDGEHLVKRFDKNMNDLSV